MVGSLLVTNKVSAEVIWNYPLWRWTYERMASLPVYQEEPGRKHGEENGRE